MIAWMGFASFLITFYHKNVPKESEKEYTDNLVELVGALLKYQDRKPAQGQDDLRKDEWRVIDKEGNVVIL